MPPRVDQDPGFRYSVSGNHALDSPELRRFVIHNYDPVIEAANGTARVFDPGAALGMVRGEEPLSPSTAQRYENNPKRSLHSVRSQVIRRLKRFNRVVSKRPMEGGGNVGSTEPGSSQKEKQSPSSSVDPRIIHRDDQDTNIPTHIDESPAKGVLSRIPQDELEQMGGVWMKPKIVLEYWWVILLALPVGFLLHPVLALFPWYHHEVQGLYRLRLQVIKLILLNRSILMRHNLLALVVSAAGITGLGLAWCRQQNWRHQETIANALQIRAGFSFFKTVLGYMPTHMSMRGEFSCVRWLNRILSDMWPSIAGYTGAMMQDYVEPLINNADMRPSIIQKLDIKRFYLGSVAPFLVSAHTHQFTTRAANSCDHIVIDFDMNFDSEMEVVFGISILGHESVLSLENVKFKTIVRFVLQPLTDEFPCFAAYSVSFVGKPFIRFDVNTKGFPLPSAVVKYITKSFTDTAFNWYVWPNRILVPNDWSQWNALEVRPTAILRARLMKLDSIIDTVMEGKIKNKIPTSKKFHKWHLKSEKEARRHPYRVTMSSNVAQIVSTELLPVSTGGTIVIGRVMADGSTPGIVFHIVLREPPMETLTLNLERVKKGHRWVPCNGAVGCLSGRMNQNPERLKYTEVGHTEIRMGHILDKNELEEEDFEVGLRVPIREGDGVAARVVAYATLGLTINPINHGLDSEVGCIYVKVGELMGMPKMDDGTGWANPIFRFSVPDEKGNYTRTWTSNPVKCPDDRNIVYLGCEHVFMDIVVRTRRDGAFKPDAAKQSRKIHITLLDADVVRT
jgi:hypothetical protein